MDTKIGVIMPQKMQGIGLAGSEQADSFPVLWLLHGRSDDYTIWMRRTSIERYAAPLGLMVIMPEVSYSRYINMKHGPRYYDYISKELPEFCAKLFPKMSRKREDNYIAGLSMGGGGAMWVGLHNPDKYGWICMLSTEELLHWSTFGEIQLSVTICLKNAMRTFTAPLILIPLQEQNTTF